VLDEGPASCEEGVGNGNEEEDQGSGDDPAGGMK